MSQVNTPTGSVKVTLQDGANKSPPPTSTLWTNNLDSVKHGTAVACRRGEKHIRAKLSNQDVKEILNKHKIGLFNQKELAKSYGVSHSTINAIITKRNWKYI